MKYHLKLSKGLSYCGVVSATKKSPDVFVEDKATADVALASGYFKLVEAFENTENIAEAVTGYLDTAQLEEMKVGELKSLAAQMGLDTSELKKKADLVAAIAAVEVAARPEDKNEADYSEQ